MLAGAAAFLWQRLLEHDFQSEVLVDEKNNGLQQLGKRLLMRGQAPRNPLFYGLSSLRPLITPPPAPPFPLWRAASRASRSLALSLLWRKRFAP